MGSERQKTPRQHQMPPEALTPVASARTPPLPIAAKADDLEEIKKAVEEAASVSGGLWLSYLFTLLYIGIAAGTVTHEHLLLVRPVTLPFLNVELPLLAFFTLAPVVVLIIHVYALMHFRMLGNKATRFDAELRRQFSGDVAATHKGGVAPVGEHKDIRDKLRRLLPSNIFVQILAGPPEHRTGFFGKMLKIVAVATLVILPVLVLLLLQIQFLPFHNVGITWVQRVVLFLDILILWPLRPPILTNPDVEHPRRTLNHRSAFGFGLAFVFSLGTIWFSFLLATIPGEWKSGPLSYIAAIEPATANKLVFGTVGAQTARIIGNWPSNTLRLQGVDIYESLKVDDPKKLDWKDYTYDLHSRRLEGEVFDDAKLGKINLNESHLEGVSLNGAKLRGASLARAHLQGASFHGTQLQDAVLLQAQIQDASFNQAHLEGASLILTHLEGASFISAYLQGASLNFARLQGASLYSTQLQGASLIGAQLQGALVFRAQMQGVELNQAKLQGAALVGTELQGAMLAAAELSATDFSTTILWRTAWGKTDPASLGVVRANQATWEPVTIESPLTIVSPGAITFYFHSNEQRVFWGPKAYADLRESINGISEGVMKLAAIPRIERLDCSNPDNDLASCDPVAKTPPEVLDWQKHLAAASVSDAAYIKALATELRSLVCENDADAIHILRGISKSERLAETGREAPALVDVIMSKDCPVSTALTDDDKARLLKIKRDAEKKLPPPPASKQDK
jgi:uncharacterized protein YjbI with pentapeptide repeats